MTAGRTGWRWPVGLAVAALLHAPPSADADPTPEAAGYDSARTAAQALLDEGQYAAAVAACRGLMDRARAVPGSDSLRLAEATDLLVESLRGGGHAREPECRSLAEQSLALRQRRLGGDDPRIADAECRLAAVLWSKGAYGPPRTTGHIVRRAALELAGAMLDTMLTNRYIETGFERSLPRLIDPHDYDRAITLYRRALAIREKALGREDPAVAGTLQDLALVLRDQGDYVGSTERLERALQILTQSYGAASPENAECLARLAELECEQAEYRPSRAHFERAIELLEQPTEPDRSGDGRSAASARRALLARTLMGYGSLLEESGDLEEARRVHERAFSEERRLSHPDSTVVASMLQHLAAVREAAGRRGESRALLEQSLGIVERARGPYHLDVATAAGLLSIARLGDGEAQEALPLSNRALEIRESALGPNHPEVARSLIERGDIEYQLGENAADDYGRAYQIYLETLGPTHPRTLLAWQRLAMAGPSGYDVLVQVFEATRANAGLLLPSLPESQALQVARQIGPTLDMLSFEAPGNHAPCWNAYIESRAMVLDAIAARHRAAPASSDTAVARLRREVAESRERLAALLVRGVGASVGDGYWSLLDSARARSDRADRALAERIEPRPAPREKHGFFKLPWARRDGDGGFEGVRDALGKGDVLVAFTRATRLERPEPAKHGQPAATPPIAKEYYRAFLMPIPMFQCGSVSIGPAADVDTLVARWRALASQPPPVALASAIPAGSSASSAAAESQLNAVGEQLRRLVWDPIAKRMHNVRRVFIVPDGALNLINFAALPDGKGGYLIESGPVLHLLSAERDLIRFSQPANPGKGFLGVGGADYDAALRDADSAPSLTGATMPPDSGGGAAYRGARSHCESLQSVRFAPLPATATEIRDVSSVWAHSTAGPPDATVLTGAEATEARLKRLAPGRAILHLATHGFFLNGRCPSADEGARGIQWLVESDAPSPARNVGENPLRLSGLAFAGANHRDAAQPGEDDGILTAEEIASLDLSGVQWAVLSACETGLGEVRQGEGVLGLRRAFQEAGARTVFTSLWSVDDESARQWMDALYHARMADHLDTAAATRQAGLTVLRDRRARGVGTHPFYWAAFVAAGDWH